MPPPSVGPGSWEHAQLGFGAYRYAPKDAVRNDPFLSLSAIIIASANNWIILSALQDV